MMREGQQGRLGRRIWPARRSGRSELDELAAAADRDDREATPQHMRRPTGPTTDPGDGARRWQVPALSSGRDRAVILRRPDSERWLPRYQVPRWVGDDLLGVDLHVVSPGGRDHQREVVQTSVREVACLAVDHYDRVLLVLRWGFGVRRSGWELPTTELLDGEPPFFAAERVVRDTCGWAIFPKLMVGSFARWPSRSDIAVDVVEGRARHEVSSPSRDLEAVEWVDRTAVRTALDVAGLVHDPVSAAALRRWLDAGAGR